MDSEIYREEFERLPRWARIALVGRCVRRLLPIFSLTKSNVYMNHSRTLSRSAMIVELTAADAATHPSASEILAEVKEAWLDARAHAAKILDIRACAAMDVADTARKAVLAATRPESVREALAAISEARSAPLYKKDYSPDGPYVLTQDAIRRDFDELLIAVRKGSWDDNTAVGPEFFGPLWPKGKPESWPS